MRRSEIPYQLLDLALCEHEKGPSPGGESIRGGIVRAVNTHDNQNTSSTENRTYNEQIQQEGP